MPEVAVLTRVRPGEEGTLRQLLRQLGNASSPFALAPGRTHFARFIVLELGGAHLLFTSKFDGSQETYLTHIAEVAVSCGVYQHCVEPPAPITPASLSEYLLADSSCPARKSYVVPKQRPEETVTAINEGIRLRAELRGFAARAEALASDEMARRFRNLPAVVELHTR